MTAASILIIFLALMWAPEECGKWFAKVRQAYDKEMTCDKKDSDT